MLISIFLWIKVIDFVIHSTQQKITIYIINNIILLVDLEIFNYSFYPVPDNVKKMGVVELSKKVNQMLKSLLEFDLIPTTQEISEYCRGIVNHAVQSNHKAVFLRNYESYQSFLISEFQKKNIRVFVPIYNRPTYAENIVGNDTINLISYLNIINITEVPNRYQLKLTDSRVSLSQFGSSYQLYIEGKLDTGILTRFDIAQGELSDIMSWFQTFISQIKSIKIQDYLISLLGFQFSDVKEFTNSLINILQEIREQSTNSAEIGEMIEIMKLISIIDSSDVQEYVSLANYATLSSLGNVRDRIKFLGKAQKVYDSFNTEYKDVITRFDTNSFKRLGIRREFKFKFNPAYLYRYLGFLSMQLNHWVDTEKYFRDSIELYKQYSDHEINEIELDTPINNHIFSCIILGKNEIALASIDQQLNNLETKDTATIIALKRYESRIYRNMGDYSKALEIILEVQKTIDRERSLDSYYIINNQIAIIYYLDGKIEQSLYILDEVINEEGISVLVKSYACYLYNLISYMDKKIINTDQLEKLSDLNVNNATDSYHSYIAILAMIERNDPESQIIAKLIEFINLYPSKVILGFVQLGIIYVTTNEWIALSELVESIIPISTKYSSYIQIKSYLCKYYLGIILDNQDLVIKNIIEKLAVENNFEIARYYLGNEIINAIEGIKMVLDMDLVKIDDYLFD